jgi:hypothetical protein
MDALLVVVLVILVLLAIIGLLAILFFVGYRKKVAAEGGRPSRFAAYQGTGCQHVPGHIYKQPDPMIYSQQYLMSQGLADCIRDRLRLPGARLVRGMKARRCPAPGTVSHWD